MKRVSVLNLKKVDDDRTFFCSELVAAVYKNLDLLDWEKASTQYWPGSFSDKEILFFNNDAKFSKEFLIDFNL